MPIYGVRFSKAGQPCRCPKCLKKRGRKKNPLLLEYLNPPGAVAGRIPGDVEEIRYQRTGKHRGPYKHKFKSPAVIHTMADGSLWIRPKRRGQRLWVDLPD